MARGWESKAVESQQEDTRAPEKTVRRTLTPEERQRESRRRSLELAVAQTQAELQIACHKAHREMLRMKLEALQAELGML